MEKENQTFAKKMLDGWKNFFSSSKENKEVSSASNLKTFPADHYYTAKDLEKLSRQENLSPIDSMALAAGLVGAIQTGDNSNKDYVPVSWKDGLMSWIDSDGNQHVDDDVARVRKLRDLKDNGYEIPSQYETLLQNYDASLFVGNVYDEGMSYLRIDGYKVGKDGESPTLDATSFNKKTMVSMNIPIELDYLQSQLNNSTYRELFDSEKNIFLLQVEEAAKTQKLFDETLKDIQHAVDNGTEISFNNIEEITKDTYNLGTVIPLGYRTDGGNIIYKAELLSYDTEDDETKINKDNAYLYRDILADINRSAVRESINKDAKDLIKALGAKKGDKYLYTAFDGSKNISFQLDARDNVSIQDNEGKELFYSYDVTKEEKDLLLQNAFVNLGKLSGDVLNSTNEYDRYKALASFLSLDKTIGNIVSDQEEYIHDISEWSGSEKQSSDVKTVHNYIQSIEEYMSTLKDEKDILSGDIVEHLPQNEELKKLYARYESLSEEASSVQFGLPHEDEYYEQLYNSLDEAGRNFNEKLRSVVGDYKFAFNMGKYGTNANNIIDTLASIDKEFSVWGDVNLSETDALQHQALMLKHYDELDKQTGGAAVETILSFLETSRNRTLLVMPVIWFCSMETYVSTLRNTYNPTSGDYERFLANHPGTTLDNLKEGVETFELLKNLNGETIHKEIQGIQGYTRDELKDLIKQDVEEKLYEAFEYEADDDLFESLRGIEIHGSRGRGTAKENSDLDVVVEYQGKAKEDTMFNILHEEPLELHGIPVDVNPIRRQETGTLKEYMEESKAYDQEMLKKHGMKKLQAIDTVPSIRFSRPLQVETTSSNIFNLREERIQQLYDKERNTTGYSGDYKNVLDSKDNWRSAVATFYENADNFRNILNPSSKDYGEVFSAIKEQEGFAETLLKRIGASQIWKSEQRDAIYMEAVKTGDMKTAHSLVNEAAAEAGYSTSSSYQGTSAFNGAAPYGNGYFNSPEERKVAWDNDEYEGDQTLEDYIKNGVDNNNLDFIALDPRNWRSADANRREAIENVRNVIQTKSDTITMYRSVPSGIKEGSFRNGDWVTPSHGYAVDNARVHGWGDNYRIIEQQVPTSEIWWDGNDIAEWGYGNEQDYVNDKDFAYKNTPNNRKSLEAVTYDDNGNIIPLSQRFNEKVADVRYQIENSIATPSKEEKELRDTLINKLRGTGIDVITDVREGQHVLDLYNGDARRQAVYHGSGASFDEFDFSHVSEGAGSQAFGWGGYVTSSKEIGKSYAHLSRSSDNRNMYHGDLSLSQLEKAALSSFVENNKTYDGNLKTAVLEAVEHWKKRVEKHPDNIFSQNIQKRIDVMEGLMPKLDKINWSDFASSGKNLYVVEIPDDNGHNYLNYDGRNSDIPKDMLESLSKELEKEGWKRRDMPSFIWFTDGYDNIAINSNATGADLYEELKVAFKSPKKASELLSNAGFVGIKYEAGQIFGGVKDGDTNYVIFKEEDMKIKDHIRFFKDKGGTSYGFTVNDKIYVDPRIATAETPIHEYTHLWATALQKGNPKEWQNIVGLMKDTPVWNEVKANYKDLKSDDVIADEVLATYSGRTGVEKLRQKMSEAKNGNLSATKKSNVQRGLFNLQQALEKFWKSVASFLGIHYTSAEQVADQVMKDILKGVNPSKALEAFTKQRDQEYEKAVSEGNMDKAYSMVKQQADMMLADNPMPEVTDAYSVRKEGLPSNTIKVYKVFTLDKEGHPSALFVSGKDKLPMGVWLNAQDTWHFTAANGKDYVPSTKNPSTQGGKTGASIEIPNDEVRQELIKRGYLPEGSKAKTITALAYRPGWHAADLPYFPQGGKQEVDSNYGHVHRYNQVVFECDMIANINYTAEAQSQDKARKADGTLNARNADLQYMPKDGFYQYTTNQFLADEDKGHWYIGSAIRINRAMTQEECDKILKENGKAVQEWEQDHLDLNKLGYASAMSHIKPILAPVAYDDAGKMIPLSERFEDNRKSIEQPRRLFIGEMGAKAADQADEKRYGQVNYRIGMLGLAKQMYEQNQSAQDIKHTTGWELGADNNWKYETEDVKRFDWNGNLVFEQNHPDFKRLKELIHKDNEHIFMGGEALRPNEVEEYDALQDKYGVVNDKMDNNQTLEAYVDAPDLYKSYPELRNVKVNFERMDGEELASFKANSSVLDFLLDTEGTEKYNGTITINTNKLNRFQLDGPINNVMSHELQHAVQGLEGFAKGGDPNTIRSEIKAAMNENLSAKDYIVGHLKSWATLNDLALKLENSQKEIQREGADWKEIGKRHYWEAMNEIDSNIDGKYNLVNDYVGKFGKDYDIMEIAKSGYHVEEAAADLRRVAQEHKDMLTSGDYFTLEQMNLMEKALDKDNNNQLYWNMAGEVEARNTARRMNMTPLERRDSLATSTEDVGRNEQIVITSTGVKGFINLDIEPVTGRWHTEKQEEKAAYREYSKLFVKLIESNHSGSGWNVSNTSAITLDGQRFDIGDSFVLSLYADKKGFETPIYVTEEQAKLGKYMVSSNAEPFKLATPLGVKKLYNISEVAPSDGNWKLLNQVKVNYEELKDAAKGRENSLSALSQELVTQLKLSSNKSDYKNESFYRAGIAEKLVEVNQGTLPDEFDKRSKQQLIGKFSQGMLGGIYDFQTDGDVVGSKELKARMERDPDFAKEVFEKAKASSCKIATFVEETVKSFGDVKKLDLRSLTPVDIDVDGNGIVESQENLAADTKQSEDDGETKTKERFQHAKAHR